MQGEHSKPLRWGVGGGEHELAKEELQAATFFQGGGVGCLMPMPPLPSAFTDYSVQTVSLCSSVALCTLPPGPGHGTGETGAGGWE